MSNSVVIMMDMLLPLLIAMAVTAVVTWRLIPALRKLNTIQHVYEDAPVTHKIKQGTPTMGGVAIIAGIIISCVFTQVRIGFSLPLLVVMLVTVGFGLIGFIDDYTKIAKRRNKGLTPKQKLALQIALSLAFAIYLVYFGDHGNFGAVIIPFVWTEINIGWLIIPYIVFILVAMTNAVNLTDGLDGLCAGTSGMVSLFYPLILIAGGMAWAAAEMPLLGDADFGAWIKAEEAIMESASNGSLINQLLPGIGGAGIEPIAQFFTAVCGACFGFLIFNRHPAKIFMGDTGSLALGGAIAAAAIWARAELLLIVVGALFVIEALSVIIQVTSYKLRHGKRVFKMAPLHHHFELSGWPETKVVSRFISFTLIVCAASLAVVVIQTYLARG